MSTSSTNDFRLVLQQELVKRCKSNKSYSLRAFARSLQIDCGTLSKILSGQRKLGKRSIQKLGLKIGIAPEELTKFFQTVAVDGENSDEQAKQIAYHQLSIDTFHIISEWYHFAILELMRVDQFKADVNWVARSLGLKVVEVNAALERLCRTGMLQIEKGKWKDLSDGTSTTIGFPHTSAALIGLQKVMLEKASTALTEVPLERRDNSTVTMAIDSKRLPEAKLMIKEFRRRMGRVLSRGGQRDDVYNLTVSFYPLTQMCIQGDRSC